MLIGAVILTFIYDTPMVGGMVVLMSMCVIGVHGMLSGTASMDFGGKQNVGTAVGIIDGFVYAGGGMSLLTMFILPDDSNPMVSGNPENWISWPISMIPISLLDSCWPPGSGTPNPKQKPAKYGVAPGFRCQSQSIFARLGFNLGLIGDCWLADTCVRPSIGVPGMQLVAVPSAKGSHWSSETLQNARQIAAGVQNPLLQSPHPNYHELR